MENELERFVKPYSEPLEPDRTFCKTLKAFQNRSKTESETMKFKRNPALEQRIEWLGQMNDRRLRANENNDIQGLLEIACEYESRRMFTTAKEIRIAVTVRQQTHIVAQMSMAVEAEKELRTK